MLNYIFTIVELDAVQMSAPKEPFEHEDDFLARLKEAHNKHFFRIIVQDGSEKQMQFESPFFDKDSDEQRFSVFARGMKEVKKVIVGRERQKKEPAIK